MVNALLKNLYKSIFAHPNGKIEESYADPTFRLLCLASDGDWWVADVPWQGSMVLFRIGGHRVPASDLVERAGKIAQDFTGFVDLVARFLAEEGRRRKFLPYEYELAELSVSAINFLWPSEDKAEIEFSGGKAGRSWACAYDIGILRNLDFDS